MHNFTLLLTTASVWLLLGLSPVFSQISFNTFPLQGQSINNPTSLQFGPDGRLYVAQQDGDIQVYTIERTEELVEDPPGETNVVVTYSVTATEEIGLIKDGVPNHNDDGAPNATQKRQVTGILVTGTATNPVIYVTSSDWRIGGGGSGTDLNLDTNSGVLSRLTKETNGWERVDLVRGLPRCEENHSTNGMAISGTTLLIQSGGHTNKGAPSNNFSGTPEYMLSGVLLRVDLDMLENNMTEYTDPRSGAKYVYDLPTLNDPTRSDIDNTNPDFPYPSDHPMYNATIDVNDPFGGNNSLNQAVYEPGGPVQIFSHGYRNAYDVVITEAGHIFTSDNGPNGGWGGQPVIYELDGSTPEPDDYIIKGVQGVDDVTYNPENGDYISNEFSEANSNGHGDPLHYVGTLSDGDGSYYAGHPAPIQVFPSKAQVIVYEEVSDGNWQETARHDFADLIAGVSGYFNNNGNTLSIDDFPDRPAEGEYRTGSMSNPDVNIIDIISSSTNGITEYTASNFGGLMQGNILTASFNGNIYRYKIASNQTSYEEKEDVFSGFGSQPLDVTAQGDNDPFPGTVWAATYGADNIVVFEPADFGECFVPGDNDYDPTADYDSDGFSNADEIAVGTNHCSGGSVPSDFDGDFSPDGVDEDDDNDGIPDIVDAFAQDPDNGTTTDLPIDYPFWNNDPGTGLFGLGFTGLMSNGVTDYLNQYDLDNLSPGGAAGKMGIDAVSEGDALTGNQENAFQFGINVDENSNPFTVRSAIESPFFLVNGSATTPVDNQSQGIYIGTGDQDNYLRVVFQNGTTSGDNTYGMQVLLEDGANVTYNETFDVTGIENAAAVEVYISVDPGAGTAQPSISLNGGGNVISLGGPVSLPSSFLDPNDNQGLAVGIIATSTGPGSEFGASWDYMTVSEDQSGTLVANPTSVDFGLVAENGPASEIDLELINLGGPTDGNVTITAIEFNGTDGNLFSTTAAPSIDVAPGNEFLLPVILTPGAVLGPKSATLSVIHNGSDSPLEIPLTAEVVENDVPLVRINAGDVMFSATDDGPDWEANGDLSPGESFTVISNSNKVSTHNIPLTGRHSSIPDYIDDATFLALFAKERWDDDTAPELQYQIPLPNADYTVNLYMGNGWPGSSEPGERIFGIAIEGELVEDNLDLSATFGHQVGAMLQYSVTVTDGVLNIEFLHQLANNPIINAIEIIGTPFVDNTISVTPIPDQINQVDDVIDLAVAATGGDDQENFTYSISGQPAGVDIESTNGQIFGTIDAAALTGGSANDGVHDVSVTVTKPSSDPVTVSFEWSVTAEDLTPSAWVQVTPSAGLDATTFNDNSFIISNTGGLDIVNVTIDLSTSVLPESVFDPLGLAGDISAKCLTTGSNNTAAEVGLTVPGDNGSAASDPDCSTVFTSPHNGIDGNEGYDVLTLDFTDFNAAEIYSFGVDIDPLSIKNDNTDGDAGSVSGFELAGATLSITFANGQTLTTTLWDEGSMGGSQAVVEDEIPGPAPSIEMVGLTLPTATNQANQTIQITGNPNAAVTLLQVDARLYIDDGGGYDIDPFEANAVMTKVLYTTTLDGSGVADIPVTLLQTSSPDIGPDGGLNHFLAVENGPGDITSLASDVLVVEYEPNTAPGGNLNLNVTLQGRDTDHSGSCTVDFYSSSDLSAPAYTFNLTADAAGDMVLPQPVAADDYQVVVKRPGYLQLVVPLTVTGDADESLGMLLAGDINGDNLVDISDFSILASGFLTNSGDPGFEPLADYNGDDLIDISDFSILAQNFLVQGAELVTN